MKTLIVVPLLLTASALSARAQGTVWFANHVEGRVSAPVVVSKLFPNTGDGEFYAQLWGSPPAGTLAPVGDPVRIQWRPDEPSQSKVGFWPGEVRLLPGVPPGTPAQVKVVAWSVRLGTNYTDAARSGMGAIGESATIPIPRTGGQGAPAALLEGLPSFQISSILGGMMAHQVPTQPLEGPVRVVRTANFTNLYWPIENTWTLAITPRIAVVAEQPGGLEVFDIQHPSLPRRLGWWTSSPGSATHVGLRGTVAVTTVAHWISPGASYALHTVDLSVPEAPRSLGVTPNVAGTPTSLAVDGDLACVARDQGGIDVFRLHVPTDPRLAGSLQHSARASAVALSDNLAVLGTGTELLTVSLADPAAPRVVGRLALPASPVALSITPSLVYALTDPAGLFVVDITSPEQPVIRGSVAVGDQPVALAAAGNFVYVTRGPFASTPQGPLPSLRVVDVSNPADPQVVGGHTLSSALGVAASGTLVATAEFTSIGLFQVGASLTLSRGGAGALELHLRGHPARRYAIEQSSLPHAPTGWTTAGEVTLTNPVQSLGPIDPRASPQSLYRARAVAP